ncbi:hypothetical protein, partial [Endozoicomonas sp. ONNA2]|uniref:hypothetical protein n=1 Tax=Endozoicomonas sp. ONNA2 TaxID=2828741 RepID=UPI0021479AF2
LCNTVHIRKVVFRQFLSDATANNPVSHNPTVPDPVSHNSIDPEDWQWDEWEDRLFSGMSKRGIRELKLSHRNLICSTLSGHIGPDEGKIFALLDHPHFEASLTAGGVYKKVDPLYIKIVIQNHKGNEMFSKLLELYETKGHVMPAGLIKSAIALGYLPKKYIDKLFQLDCQ